MLAIEHDRREIARGIERRALDERQDPQQARRDEQRVTVGRRLRYDLARNHARRPVVDEHLLAEAAREAGRDQPCREIVAAARFGGDDADGFGRISSARRPCRRQRNGQRDR